MSKFRWSAAVAATITLAISSYATGAMADGPMVTKAPMLAGPAATGPATCGGAYEFFLTNCTLSWWGVTFYGTVDMGGTYQTHGTPFDRNFPTGASYFLQKPNRQAGFGLAPNGLSQSVVGIKSQEPIAPGWNFVSTNELAFDPYSALLANAPLAMQNAIGVPLNQQLLPVDSSRWGWLAGQNFAGVNSPTWGTLTFGRQNTLDLDLIIAYDPMGASYAFSPIGFSGLACGSGDTEECRWTTAIKYRVNVGPVRLGLIGQPLGYGAYNPNTGAIQGNIGGDVKNLGPGTLSVDIVGAFDRDAVNIGPTNPAGTFTTNGAGMPTSFPANTFLQATISNQASASIGLKYTFGSWASAPLVGKEPLPPPVVPLTLYAGYEYIQFSNPSDPQSAFYDDGFLFNAGPSVTGGAASPNGTAINNNAFNSLCSGVGSTTPCSNKIFQVMWVGAKYGITKNLDIIGAYYNYQQNQYISGTSGGLPVCANSGAHSQCQGTEDMWSVLLDWRFLPKWDWYIGTFFSQVNGGLANGYLSRNNLATTSGVRFRF